MVELTSLSSQDGLGRTDARGAGVGRPALAGQLSAMMASRR